MGPFPVLDTVGTLYPGDNPLLRSMRGMEELSVVYDLQLRDSIALDGLSDLRQVNYFVIDEKMPVNSIDDILSATDLENGSIGELQIATDRSFDLSNIDQLGGLWKIGFWHSVPADLSPLVSMQTCFALDIRDGRDWNLESLDVLDGACIDALLIDDMPNLRTIAGPDYSQLVGLELSDCPVLHDIGAADVATSLHYEWIQRDYHAANFTRKGGLVIRDCPMLSDCDVQPVCQRVRAGLVRDTEIMGNGLGCSSPAEVEVACQAVSSSDVSTSSPLVLQPNPVRDYIEIAGATDDVSWRIYDRQGRLCSSGVGRQVTIIDLASGVYVLEAQTADGDRSRSTFVKL